MPLDPRDWPPTHEERVEGWPPVTKLGGHPVWIGTALEGSGVLYPLEDTSSDRYYLYYLGR